MYLVISKLLTISMTLVVLYTVHPQQTLLFPVCNVLQLYIFKL